MEKCLVWRWTRNGNNACGMAVISTQNFYELEQAKNPSFGAFHHLNVEWFYGPNLSYFSIKMSILVDSPELRTNLNHSNWFCIYHRKWTVKVNEDYFEFSYFIPFLNQLSGADWYNVRLKYSNTKPDRHLAEHSVLQNGNIFHWYADWHHHWILSPVTSDIINSKDGEVKFKIFFLHHFY